MKTRHKNKTRTNKQTKKQKPDIVTGIQQSEDRNRRVDTTTKKPSSCVLRRLAERAVSGDAAGRTVAL